MTWSISVNATAIKDFADAVDKATASGEVARGIAGLQITQAKAMLTALGASGALGVGKVGATAEGHGEPPASFTVTVQEFEDVPVAVPVAETAEAEATEEASEVEPVPTPVPVAPPTPTVVPPVGPPGAPQGPPPGQ